MMGISFSSRTSWQIDFESPVSVVKPDRGIPTCPGSPGPGGNTVSESLLFGARTMERVMEDEPDSTVAFFPLVKYPITFHLNIPIPAAGMMGAKRSHTVQALARGSPGMPVWWRSHDQTTAPRKGDSKGKNGWLNRPFSHWLLGLQSGIWSYLENWEICLHELPSTGQQYI